MTTRWGSPLVANGFVECFLRVPRLLGCTAAAMLPKKARGTFRKHVTKPSEHVAAPPSTFVVGVGKTTINDLWWLSVSYEVGASRAVLFRLLALADVDAVPELENLVRVVHGEVHFALPRSILHHL